jgi:uncharacterized OsmC-like protein
MAGVALSDSYIRERLPQQKFGELAFHELVNNPRAGAPVLSGWHDASGIWLRARWDPKRGEEDEVQPETIRQTVSLFEGQPEKAKSKPTVVARTDGAQAAMEAGPFSLGADLPEPLGGTNRAPSPTALLLSALAGCAAVFIRDTLAPQLGVRVEAVEATAQCEADARGLLGMASAEPDLKNIRLDVRVQSPDSEAAVRKLYEAWQERCPIYLALTKAMDVSLNMETTRQ